MYNFMELNKQSFIEAIEIENFNDLIKKFFNDSKENFTDEKKYFILLDDKFLIAYAIVYYDFDGYRFIYELVERYKGQGFGRLFIDNLENYLATNCSLNIPLEICVSIRDIAKQYKLLQIGYSSECYNEEWLVYRKYLCKTNNKRKTLVMKKNKPILFLTNNMNSLKLYTELLEREECVLLYSNKLSADMIDNIEPFFVISYNYSYIIKEDIIMKMRDRIINMHISLLPWNRGASPNFWSFIEDTPKGVTIHYIDTGLDTGKILVQKELHFDEAKETFRTTYIKLHEEIKELLLKNWEKIKNNKIEEYATLEEGSYHAIKEFEEFTNRYPIDWNETIKEYKDKILLD